MSHILFLEVDPEDEKLVHEHVPGATVMREAPQGDDLLAACKDADVVSCFIQTRFTKDVLQQLPKLKLLCTRSVGYDHIDAAECSNRGIIVCNVPDYGSHVIAEHVFALLLSTLRHIHKGQERIEGGRFDYHGLRGMALREKTIGIVGTGKIGRRVAEIAHGFGMKILAADQCRTVELVEKFGVRYVAMDELLAGSDIVTLHLPEMPQTHHLINDAAFTRMKQGVILVNTARGGLIDSDAMLKALDSGKLAYALLDVMEHEQNIRENAAIIQHPKVVATPHIAFYADDSMRSMYMDSFQSIEQWQRGETPLHIIQPPTVICDLPPIKNDE